jgi:tetratricopeptide (TPR) repeat protein
MMNRLIIATALGFVMTLTTAIGRAEQVAPQAREPRFDELVRADFFAGIAGDAAAMERAMRLIEETLAKNPRHPEALAWRGSSFIGRAQIAFEKGDSTTGNDLFQRGLREMNDAVAIAPENVGVLIPRGATLLEMSRSVPDPSRAREMLSTAVADYEKVLALQASFWKYLSAHARGELLYGLAEGLHRLGDRPRSRTYFERLLAEAPNSQYGTMAETWLKNPAAAKQRGCVGCHN